MWHILRTLDSKRRTVDGRSSKERSSSDPNSKQKNIVTFLPKTPKPHWARGQSAWKKVNCQVFLQQLPYASTSFEERIKDRVNEKSDFTGVVFSGKSHGRNSSRGQESVRDFGGFGILASQYF